MRTLRMLAMAVLLAVAVLPAYAGPGPAPNFRLELFDGKTLSLGDLKGKPFLILFWANW